MTHPIAIFDSGFGGLTVVKELMERLPGEDLIYFGDTARVPFGTKSAQTVIRFSLEIVDFLAKTNPKMIVVACNTASATALDILRRRVPVPVLGVIEPGAQAAAAASQTGHIGVIATEATIRSQAYKRAIVNIRPGAFVHATACPLLVPIVEEGRPSEDPVVHHAVQGYLRPLKALDVDALILGCTHYPLLQGAIAAEMGPGVSIINSAREMARSVADRLAQDGLAEPAGRRAAYRFFASDNPDRFAVIGQRFLGHVLNEVDLAVVDECDLLPG